VIGRCFLRHARSRSLITREMEEEKGKKKLKKLELKKGKKGKKLKSTAAKR